MIIAMIISIVAAIGLPVLTFKVQKYFSDKKIDKLNDIVFVKDTQIAGLRAEKEQRVKEQKSGVAHRERVELGKKKTEKLKAQIDTAHTDDEIMNIMALINADNDFRVGK